MTTKLKGKAPTEVKPGRPKILVYGPPKVGKSWLVTAFPRPFLIDTEGGADLPHYQKRLKDAGGWYLGRDDGSCEFDTIFEQINVLATTKHPYKTLVIDSITKVYQTRIAREAEKLGDKDAYGASKKPAIAAMRRLIDVWFPKLDMNIILVAQEVAIWGADGGRERKQTGYGPDVWEKTPYELHLTLRVQKHSAGFRSATIQDSRLPSFPDFDRFDLQSNGTDVGYANFSARFGKDYIEADVQPTVMAQPAQLAEIGRIVNLLKIDADEVSKKLAKYNAEAWGDLTQTQADSALKTWLMPLLTAPAKENS